MLKKILLIFETRPELIKMVPLVKEFQKHPEFFDSKVCLTTQLQEILDQSLDFLDIKLDNDFCKVKK